MDKVFLYIIDTVFLEDTALFNRFFDQMPYLRREKIKRLRMAADKRLSLGAGVLLRFALKKQGIDPDSEIAFNENGKPFLKNDIIKFNIAHSGKKVICAVSKTDVGCDIEKINEAAVKVVSKFAKEEISATDNSLDKTSMFFNIWTLKESYLKATGSGITTPLDSFYVYPTCDKICFSGGGFAFWQKDIITGYKCAVCAKSKANDLDVEIINVNLEKLGEAYG